MNGDPTKVNPLDLQHKDRRLNLLEAPIADVSERPELSDGTYDRLRNTDPDGPVLVWKGKPPQDAEPLVVPTAPLVVQEHITPASVLSRLPRINGQVSLFNEGRELQEGQEFESYQHQVGWKNRLILGDSLRVMQSLAEAEDLRGQVQCIYVDPPYGIKFGSNWQPSTRRRDVKDSVIGDGSREAEVIQAFRDTWELGVNSYLSYLRDRLVLANELLSESGSVFVQIGDENVHRVRALLDELFGSENYVVTISVQKTGGRSGELLPSTVDNILWYAKNLDEVKYRSLYLTRKLRGAGGTGFKNVLLADGTDRTLTPEEQEDLSLLPRGSRLWSSYPLTSDGVRSTTTVSFEYAGKSFHPGLNNHWKLTPEKLSAVGGAGRLLANNSQLRWRAFFDDYPVVPLTAYWDDLGGASQPIYVVQTNERIVERCLLMASDPGDLVLDPTCGSGTTAVVAEQWARRWITVDTSRVAVTLARQRLLTVRYPWYLLNDSDDGAMRAQKEGLTTVLPPPYKGDLKGGFVCETVPHVTLKSIADNPMVESLLEDYRPRLVTLLEAFCPGGCDWTVDDVPPPNSDLFHDNSPVKENPSYLEFIRLRTEYRSAIEATIRRHAEREVLHDRPYEDPKRVRVTGPFTVESLVQESGRGAALVPTSTAEDERPETERTATREDEGGTFESRVMEFLMKDGIVNPDDKAAKICFDAVEPVGDPDLSATAMYTDAKDNTVRAAVLIAPESRAVTKKDVRLAARAALQGVGHEALFVLAFGFEPDVAQGKQGEIFVYPVRLGHELQFGDKTLKKTGTGGLFTLFGDPDVKIEPLPDGRLRAKLEGLDVYNPMTREAKSVGSGGDLSEDDGLDAVAAWFVDTAYDGTAFHVRQAYFLGGKNPYERLQKALRAEIDESAFAQLLGATGQPFPRPETGRVAVKVVNHYGDEAFRVLNV